MKFKVLYFISLLMLVTGVFWGTWFTLTRSLQSFPAEEFMHIGKVIIANVALPMRILMPSCILLMTLSLWFYPQKKSYGFYFNCSALVFILITLLITLLVLVPIDNQINLWTSATIPSDFEETRTRWEYFHAIRTFTSLASFGCFALSIHYPKQGL